jgi:hypothetical protein
VRVVIGLLLIAGLTPGRDWKRNPAVVEFSTTADIFAIGDAHSDYVRLTNAMRTAGIVDASAHWSAARAVLVTTGDMIDKGPRAVEVLRLLRALQSEADRAGGRVVVLAGNHEAEFMANPSDSKFDEFAAQLSSAGMKREDVAHCKSDIGEFLCALPFAAKINDWYFSHAGNTKGRTIAQLERDVEADFDQHGFAAPQLIGDYSILEARLNGVGKGREPWIDGGVPEKSEKQLLGEYARAMGVAHIVQGHVPSPVQFSDGVKRDSGQMFQRWGLLFLIDTGMSEGVNESLGAVLRITATSAAAICPTGVQTGLWNVKTPQDLGRAPVCR